MCAPTLFTLAVTTLLSVAQHGIEPPTNPALPRMPAPMAERGPFAVMAETEFTLGNVAVSPNDRLFVSMHPFGSPEIRVAEVLRNGGLRAYPTDDWARGVNANGVGIESIIGLRCDAKGVLWLLDIGSLNSERGLAPKLIAWDTVAERLVRVIHIPQPTSTRKSFLQDFAIDPKREVIYIADCGIGQGFDNATPALIVVYLRTGMSRRVLDGAACVQAEPNAAMVIEGRDVGLDAQGKAPRIGVNPITIDAAHEWVYFGSMHGTTVWKVKADDLANPGLPPKELEQRVVRHGAKPVSDGITIDSAGNLYITDLTSQAIGVLAPDGSYRILHRDDELLPWPDGMCGGPGGEIYVTVNQLHRHAALAGGTASTKPPFRVLRFSPLAPAVVGR